MIPLRCLLPVLLCLPLLRLGAEESRYRPPGDPATMDLAELVVWFDTELELRHDQRPTPAESLVLAAVGERLIVAWSQPPVAMQRGEALGRLAWIANGLQHDLRQLRRAAGKDGEVAEIAAALAAWDGWRERVAPHIAAWIDAARQQGAQEAVDELVSHLLRTDLIEAAADELRRRWDVTPLNDFDEERRQLWAALSGLPGHREELLTQILQSQPPVWDEKIWGGFLDGKHITRESWQRLVLTKHLLAGGVLSGDQQQHLLMRPAHCLGVTVAAFVAPRDPVELLIQVLAGRRAGDCAGAVAGLAQARTAELAGNDVLALVAWALALRGHAVPEATVDALAAAAPTSLWPAVRAWSVGEDATPPPRPAVVEQKTMMAWHQRSALYRAVADARLVGRAGGPRPQRLPGPAPTGPIAWEGMDWRAGLQLCNQRPEEAIRGGVGHRLLQPCGFRPEWALAALQVPVVEWPEEERIWGRDACAASFASLKALEGQGVPAAEMAARVLIHLDGSAALLAHRAVLAEALAQPLLAKEDGSRHPGFAVGAPTDLLAWIPVLLREQAAAADLAVQCRDRLQASGDAAALLMAWLLDPARPADPPTEAFGAMGSPWAMQAVKLVGDLGATLDAGALERLSDPRFVAAVPWHWQGPDSGALTMAAALLGVVDGRRQASAP